MAAAPERAGAGIGPGGARRAGGPARAGALLRRLGPHAADSGHRTTFARPLLPHRAGNTSIILNIIMSIMAYNLYTVHKMKLDKKI